MKILTVFSFLAIFFPSFIVSDDSNIISPEFQNVTCMSTIKLQNTGSLHFLHSHSIHYGTGSGQQSVTAFHAADDPNSYFKILEPFGADHCPRG